MIFLLSFILTDQNAGKIAARRPFPNINLIADLKRATRQAARRLERIQVRDRQAAAVLLTLADIYQYRIKDLPQAVSFLREYLAVDNDPEIRARLAELEGGARRSPERSAAAGTRGQPAAW